MARREPLVYLQYMQGVQPLIGLTFLFMPQGCINIHFVVRFLFPLRKSCPVTFHGLNIFEQLFGLLAVSFCPGIADTRYSGYERSGVASS